ncbi:hypothetical protein EDD16DRAFT_1732807 [Pisolithus croceorrhizus]|nr:hypothetical protein EDD16DRAFT_1732807 [Pisolithus croceorrhizus]
MDETPVTNFNLRLSSPKFTGVQNDKGSQHVKAPFQFLAGKKSSSKSQGFHFAGPSFLRSNFSPPGNVKAHENTPTQGVNVENHYSPFSFPGLRSSGNPIPKGKAEEKPTVQSMVPQSCAKVVQGQYMRMNRFEIPRHAGGTHKLVHDCSTSRDSTAELNQAFLKPKEESAEASLTWASDHEEDLLLTITTKYRQAQREILKQREINADLEAQLTKRNEENTALSVCVAAQRQTLHKLKENYSDLKTEVENLKAVSTSSTSFLTEARQMMHGLADLRDEAQLGLRGLESVFDESGMLILSSETRTTVEELRSELSKTQQVTDLLRDRLHSMASELAEARSRVLELESLVAGDVRSVESITLQLQHSTKHISELVGYLHEQRNESARTAAEVYEMQQQLSHATARVKEAESELASTTRRFIECQETAEDQKVQLQFLRNTAAFQERSVKDLEARAEKAIEDLHQALGRSRELEVRLDAAKDLEKNLLEQNQLILSERDVTNQTLRTMQHQIDEAHARELSLSRQLSKITAELDIVVAKDKDLEQEAESYRRKHAESSVALKELHKQFDDQSIALGSLQERLHSAEMRTSEVTSELKSEIVRLREQKGSLESRLDTALREKHAKTETLMALRTEAARKEGAVETLLHEEKQRADEARRQVLEMESKVQSLHQELDQKNKRVRDMERCIAEHEEEVAKLTSRVTELVAMEQVLSSRATTITQRYTRNDLNDDEKILVTTLMQKARALHDREIVEKNNEIKRRDNLIKQCEARISQLEENLARRIHEPTWGAVTVSHVPTLEDGSPLTDPDMQSAPGLDCQPMPLNICPIGGTRPSETLIHPPIVSSSKQLPKCLSFSKLATESDDDAESPGDNRLPDTPTHPGAASTSSKQPAGSPSPSKLATENDGNAGSGKGRPLASNKRATFAEGTSEAPTPRPTRRPRYSKPTEGDNSADKAPQLLAKKRVAKRR